MTADPRVVGGRQRLPAGLIDTHAHLTDERFTGDLDAVLARALAAGVTAVVTCGEDVASSERAVELARREPMVRAAVGIHPHRAADCDAMAIDRLRALARDAAVVAIGEIGLDLSGRSAPRDVQEHALATQLELAVALGKPVCLHVRDAGEALREIIDHYPGIRGYVHCYSETADEVEHWVRRGFWVSFAGTVTYPRADALRAAAAVIPDDRLLLETDSPALAPQPHRGRRNEPAFVADTYAQVAALRGLSAAELADRVRTSASALFGTSF